MCTKQGEKLLKHHIGMNHFEIESKLVNNPIKLRIETIYKLKSSLISSVTKKEEQWISLNYN